MNKRGAIAAVAALVATAGLFASTSNSASQAQPTIGLIVPPGNSPPAESGAQSAAAALGDQLVVTEAQDTATELSAIGSLIAQHAAAIVVATERIGGPSPALLPALAQARAAGIPTLSFEQRDPGSVWVSQSSNPARFAHAIADALAAQMKRRGQYVIVSCRRADPVIGTYLTETKPYIRRRYPYMHLAGVVYRGVEHPPGSGVVLRPVLIAHPHLRGLDFLCPSGTAVAASLLSWVDKAGRVFSAGNGGGHCPPIGFLDAGPIRAGATEIVCQADWTRLGYLTIWAADRLGRGQTLTPGLNAVGGPIGSARYFRHNEELRLLVPPLTLTKANVDRYVLPRP